MSNLNKIGAALITALSVTTASAEDIEKKTISITPQSFHELTDSCIETSKRLESAVANKPTKDEFETTAAHQKRVEVWEQQIDLKKARINTEVDATSWYLVTPATTELDFVMPPSGNYNADTGCFEKGVGFKIDFDTGRYGFSVFAKQMGRVDVTDSQTIGNSRFYPGKNYFTAQTYKICMPPEEARKFKEEEITAHLTLHKNSETGTWIVSGDFLTEDGQPVPVTKD